MAISPREAAKRTDRAIEDELRAYEQRIDRALSSAYSTGRRVEIDGTSLPHDHFVRDALLARYRNVGWRIEHYTGSQREPANTFIFSAKRTSES